METKEKVSKAPEFLDIQEINGIPFMFLRFDEKIQKNEWLCLEVEEFPQMQWWYGEKWCKSKGGQLPLMSTLRFIFENISKINEKLALAGYPLITDWWHWSSNDCGEKCAWRLKMKDGCRNDHYKSLFGHIRAVIYI